MTALLYNEVQRACTQSIYCVYCLDPDDEYELEDDAPFLAEPIIVVNAQGNFHFRIYLLKTTYNYELIFRCPDDISFNTTHTIQHLDELFDCMLGKIEALCSHFPNHFILKPATVPYLK
jgi:hypothetical protein